MSLSKALNRRPPSQGIGAVLVEDRARTASSSIRRTLSADMSSKGWLHQNGFFSHIKKANSCDREEEEAPCLDDVWRNIQQENGKQKPPAQGTLIKHKSDSSVLPPRSVGVMTEKSLQICTESLGSETGSDCSCCSCSAADLQGSQEKGGKRAERKRSPSQPLPPPLPSISGGVGTTLQMHSRRENGRLVLEAVPEPPRNRFLAQRRDGRLVLSLARAKEEEAAEDDEAVDDDSVFIEEGTNLQTPPSGMMSAHGNKNLGMMTETENVLIPKSLLRPPRVARLIPSPPSTAPSASINTYDYFWRSSPTAMASTPAKLKRTRNFYKHSNTKISGTIRWNSNQDLVVTQGSERGYNLEGCKETRRLIQFWDLYCIATS